MDTADEEATMKIHRNAKATALYAKAETATIMADFALDMLASAHRTGMDTMSETYESLRLNTVAAISAARAALDDVGRTEQADEYITRYNDVIGA